MSRSLQAFFLLLRSGLWERDVQDLSPFPLSEQEWTEVLRMSERQTVQGLLYRGFQHLPEHLFPPQPLVWQWVAIGTRLEKEFRLFCTHAEATYRLLAEAGASPVLQKGLAVAQYYEHPAMRVNGDIDWYVGQEDVLVAIGQRLIKEGVHLEHHSDKSMSFDYEGTEVELHHQMIDIERPRYQKAVKELLSAHHPVLSSLRSRTISSAVRIPAPIPTLVMLNAHLMKHTFTVGVGLRQFCDMARAYHSLRGLYHVEELEDVYHKTGLWKWSGLLHHFLIRYLDMPIHELPAPIPAQPRDARRLFNQVLQDGNFGHHTTQWQTAHSKGRNRWHTVRQIIHRLPISLQYAPAEMFYKLLSLS